MNPMLFVQSRRFQHSVIATLQGVGRAALQWIATAIERSGELAEDSLWDWENVLEFENGLGMNFGIFSLRIYLELQKIKNTTIAEDSGGNQGSTTSTELTIHPFTSGSPPGLESRGITDLRNLLRSLHNIFPPVYSPFISVEESVEVDRASG